MRCEWAITERQKYAVDKKKRGTPKTKKNKKQKKRIKR